MIAFRPLTALTLTFSLLAGFVPAADTPPIWPDLGDTAQVALSPQAEQKLGRQIMGKIRASGDMLDDPEVTAYLNQLGARLARASTVEYGQAFQFFPMLDKQINAFALPGGYISVQIWLIYTAQDES